MQGSLSNPNIAIEAAKAGRIDQLNPAIGTRVDGRALRDAQDSGVAAVCITLGHVVGSGEPFAMLASDIQAWDAFIGWAPNTFRKIDVSVDIRSCHETRRIGVIYGFQNTEMLGDDTHTPGADRAHRPTGTATTHAPPQILRRAGAELAMESGGDGRWCGCTHARHRPCARRRG